MPVIMKLCFKVMYVCVFVCVCKRVVYPKSGFFLLRPSLQASGHDPMRLSVCVYEREVCVCVCV